MTLCEIIPALQTSQETVDRATKFAIAMGKEITVSKDTPGFISNRLLMPFINEVRIKIESLFHHIPSHLIPFPTSKTIIDSSQQAIIVLETGIASKEDIDKTLRLGMAHPMGPLALADFIGLDTCLSIQQVLHEETGDSKYRPSVLLGRMVSAGWMGKKSGKGFYDY